MTLTTRRRAREVVLRVLYQADVNDEPIDDVTKVVVEGLTAADDLLAFIVEVTGVVADRRSEIDGLIADASTNWTVSRMASIDRNVMRAAVAELIARTDVDARVIIDEAVSIAAAFGTDGSGAFVNGILDVVARGIRSGELGD